MQNPYPVGYQDPICTSYQQQPQYSPPLGCQQPVQGIHIVTPLQYQSAQEADYAESVRRFNELAQRNEICKDFIDRLRNLDGIEIVIIADDSGSMCSALKNPRPEKMLCGSRYTRWMELQDFLNTSIDIISTIDNDGCDVYFLNRPPVLNITKKEQLVVTFCKNPNGYTPLVERYEEVLRVKKDQIKEKGLLVIIATDGEPTTSGNIDIDSFRTVLSHTKKQFESSNTHKSKGKAGKVFTTILACTDEEDTMNYLNNWDKEIERLDIVDDYNSEKNEILRAQGTKYKFTYGEYVVKIIMGSSDDWFDKLDELKNTTSMSQQNDANNTGCCSVM